MLKKIFASKKIAFWAISQIVDKLDENINWAIQNWYFHFFMLKIFIYHSKYKKTQAYWGYISPILRLHNPSFLRLWQLKMISDSC